MMATAAPRLMPDILRPCLQCVATRRHLSATPHLLRPPRGLSEAMVRLWTSPSLYLDPTASIPASATAPASNTSSTAPPPPPPTSTGHHHIITNDDWDSWDWSQSPVSKRPPPPPPQQRPQHQDPAQKADSTSSSSSSSSHDNDLSSLFKRHYWRTHLDFASSFFGHSHPNPGTSRKPNSVGHPHILYSADSFYDHAANEIVPEVLIIGCSNVGKSTLINAVLGCEKLARMSPFAGCTKLVNAYGAGPPAQSMNLFTPETKETLTQMSATAGASARQEQNAALRSSLILLDTPGYGHSSVSEWGRHIEKFISKRRMLKGVVLLLRGEMADTIPTKHDAIVLRMLASAKIPFRVVLTRLDRAGGTWPRACAQIAEKVRAVLGYKADAGVTRWGTDEKGRPLWDGGVWATAAGIDRKMFRKSRADEPADLGITGVRAAILDMAGLGVFKDGGKGGGVVPDAAPVRGKRDVEGENEGEEEDDDDDVVPFDQIRFVEKDELRRSTMVAQIPKKKLPSEMKRSRSLRRRNKKIK